MKTTTRSATSVCSSCQHWSNASSDQGECRRHAPQMLVFTIDAETKFESRFPTTKAADWCGEFEEK
ncbi:MAG: hypothetical protein HC845_01295 [Akkermansiaceae bacterium]|nr:hypothetical protein [Akkermansiaceae bacterium]